jgi:hypothetical protein
VPPSNQQPQYQQPVQPPAQPAGFSPMPNQQFQPPQQMPQSAPPAQGPISGGQQQPAPTERKANSTQNSLLISELREGMAIMADGSFRAVIACRSINFDLMSSREREGVEFSYQNFLNALYFPIQIFIRSQRVDIGPYLDRLEDIRKSQDNMLLNVLMDDYIQFVDILAQEANIMDKSFFVIVPFFPAGDANKVMEQGKGFFSSLFGGSKGNGVTRIDKVTYDKAKDEIKNRVDAVISGLSQVGIQSVQLTTKELGELYYNVYNPDTAVREPLGNFDTVTSTYVRKAAAPNQPGSVPQPPQGGAV